MSTPLGKASSGLMVLSVNWTLCDVAPGSTATAKHLAGGKLVWMELHDNISEYYLIYHKCYHPKPTPLCTLLGNVTRDHNLLILYNTCLGKPCSRWMVKSVSSVK